ncbi:MAG: 16S rRNA (guanine(966)-N(2))-methyltransferase RsmD [Woeseiaceae bacterium]
MAKRKSENKSQPGRLRIVAGNWRSRLLEIADVPGLRPTSSRIRETVFNWLAPRIAGAHCLDLFAGTGALGLEALSRGAASCDFVESSSKAAKSLRANIATLESHSARVHESTAQDFLEQAGVRQYEILFLDPPFAADLLPELCRLIEAGNLLTGDARIYVEEDRNQPMFELPERWQVLKSKETGNVRYSLLEVGNNQ